MKNRTVEILAPAGSYESMVAAVNAGADAVYIGGSRSVPVPTRTTWMRRRW
ncbi:MAG: hypothetical protein ACLU48_01130 [Clostridiaceae bacterium]